ncbi:MAG TPA: mitofilin family membrane protein [Rhizomicrobium sp.]|nr:mitofilin family membrane protein [Rhizomicrobium sp.]
MTDSDQRPFAALPSPEGDEPLAEEPRPRRSLFPDGAVGILVLLVIAAASGGLIATYWPLLHGGGGDASGDRISALETRVAQIARGRAPNVAAAEYSDEQKTIAALRTRLDADEARLTALEGAAPGGDGGALKAEFDQLGARVARLEKAPPGAGVPRAEFDTRTQGLADAANRLSFRVGALERTAPPADLAARLDSFALKSGEDALLARVVRLESRDASEEMKRAAMLLALADLARASAAGQPFAPELTTLRALDPAAPELAGLAKYAASGAPAQAALAGALSADAGAILAAERESKATGWSQRLWANVSNLVTIRRIGAATGDSTESRLARAEADARGGNLASAVAEMSALKGAAAQAAAPWLAGARARLAIDAGTRALTSRILAAMQAPEHP